MAVTMELRFSVAHRDKSPLRYVKAESAIPKSHNCKSRMLKWICIVVSTGLLFTNIKVNAKERPSFEFQDTNSGFNGDIEAIEGRYIFTPGTNKSAVADWKGKRVEVEENNPFRKPEGSVWEYPFQFTVLDDGFVPSFSQTARPYFVIHQLWSNGSKYPKHIIYLQRFKDGQIYLQSRHTDKSQKHFFSKPYRIKVNESYDVKLKVKIGSVGESRGYYELSINDILLKRLPKVHTQDAANQHKEIHFREKFGIYSNKILAGEFPPSLQFVLQRNWLPLLNNSD
jgi:hypothetical protein